MNMLRQGGMAQGRLQFNEFRSFEATESASGIDVCEEAIASPEREAEVVASLQVVVPTCIRLNLEDLKCFEVVERQYQRWGVIFKNCVAIQPSNPAFPPHFGTTVLMGAPKGGFLEATFLRPVRSVSSFITSSQQTILTAYDDKHQLLQAELPGHNLAGSDSQLAANAPLSIRAANIHRITFCAFDGQFTIDDFRFIC